MAEIQAIPYSGLTAISTFSGCGGSSLGYRMAGYKVLWANEFIPAAADTYRANFASTILDTRDIREIQPNDILDATGLEAGQLDLMDGSPPCAAFSMAGQREDGWGKVKNYSDTTQRVDDLFWEYARLIRGIQPRVFVGENVAGLTKGKAKGYYLEILAALRDCGYQVQARLVDSQWLGVPQTRVRCIFVGVRNDLNLQPVFPTPLPYNYTLREALDGLDCSDDFRETISPYMTKWWENTEPGRTLDEGHMRVDGKSSGMTKTRLCWDKVAPTIMARGGGTCDYYHPDMPKGMAIRELKRIGSFPDDFILTGNYKQQWERIGRAVPPVMMAAIASTIRDQILLCQTQ